MVKKSSENAQPENMEPPRTREKLHTSFISKNEELLKNRLMKTLGRTAIVTGIIFALAGIGDIIPNGGISEFIRNTGLPMADNLANLPLFLKIGGGASLIGIGRFIERQDRRQ